MEGHANNNKDEVTPDPQVIGQFVFAIELLSDQNVVLRTQSNNVHPAITIHWMECYLEKIKEQQNNATKDSIVFYNPGDDPKDDSEEE